VGKDVAVYCAICALRRHPGGSIVKTAVSEPNEGAAMSSPADPMEFWGGIYTKALEEENSIDFDSFSHADAWALGSAMVTTATEHVYPVAIAIVFGEQRVFHAALKGSSATNDDWLRRKFNAVYKHNCSSYALECQQRAMGGDYFADNGYQPADIAVDGGAVPLRVQGSLIGAVGMSGLEGERDHYFVLDALANYAR
jgi:uncharacterized protein (UPF0303 family)